MRKIFYLLFIAASLSILSAACAKKGGFEATGDGEYLFTAAGCTLCHNFNDEQDAAYPLKFLVNGALTEEQFATLVREGIGPDGDELSLMPFDYYYKIKDKDIALMYDYYVKITGQTENVVKSGRFESGERFSEDSSRSNHYNRGEYLVTALGYCGHCHTEDDSKPLAGGTYNDWDAYNISSDKVSGVGGWSSKELESYLKHGVVPGKGNAAGIMGEYVEFVSSRLADSDITAIATYLKENEPYKSDEIKPRDSYGTLLMDMPDRQNMLRLDKVKTPSGSELYNSTCATCHNWDGGGINPSSPEGFPSLINNTTVGAKSPNNLILVILQGTSRLSGKTEIFMPAFADRMTDEEMARLVNFIEKQFGNTEASVSASDISGLR